MKDKVEQKEVNYSITFKDSDNFLRGLSGETILEPVITDGTDDAIPEFSLNVSLASYNVTTQDLKILLVTRPSDTALLPTSMNGFSIATSHVTKGGYLINTPDPSLAVLAESFINSMISSSITSLSKILSSKVKESSNQEVISKIEEEVSEVSATIGVDLVNRVYVLDSSLNPTVSKVLLISEIVHMVDEKHMLELEGILDEKEARISTINLGGEDKDLKTVLNRFSDYVKQLGISEEHYSVDSLSNTIKNVIATVHPDMELDIAGH